MRINNLDRLNVQKINSTISELSFTTLLTSFGLSSLTSNSKYARGKEPSQFYHTNSKIIEGISRSLRYTLKIYTAAYFFPFAIIAFQKILIIQSIICHI